MSNAEGSKFKSKRLGLTCGWCLPNRGCNAKRSKNYKTRKDRRYQKLKKSR